MEGLFKSHLPQLFQNKIERFTEKENGFSALVRTNCKTPEEASFWICEYGKLSLTKWNVKRNYDSQRLAFRKDWICHLTNWQLVSKNGPRSKARGCSAKIIFKIKFDTKDTRKNDSRIKDGLLSVIAIDSVHSHPIENAHALSFLKADENVRKRFYQLFDDGYTAAEAARYIRAQIDSETDGDEIALADASRVPSMRTVSYWYGLWRTGKYGKNSIARNDVRSSINEESETANRIDENMETEPTLNENSDSAGSSFALEEKANEMAALIRDKIAKFGDSAGESNLIDGIDKFMSRLKNVSNATQLTAFFHTCGSGVVEKS